MSTLTPCHRMAGSAKDCSQPWAWAKTLGSAENRWQLLPPRPSQKASFMNERTNTMNRRELLQRAAKFGLMAAVPFAAVRELLASSDPNKVPSGSQRESLTKPNPLNPPARGSIPVAFLLSEGAVVIDFCGPWEVFENVNVPGRASDAFHLYTVAETTKPIRASGGMKIIPEYTFETAPAPKIIVIPAQNGQSEAMLEWIRRSSKNTDVTMSVCTGAFVLASTGLLSGKSATTFHSAFSDFAFQFPDIQLKRGARFVENGNLATSGGLSLASICRCAWWNAISAAESPATLPTNWNTRGKAGWIQIQIRFTPRHASQRMSIHSARCARWMSIRRPHRNLFIRVKAITSACRTTRTDSTPPRTSS